MRRVVIDPVPYISLLLILSIIATLPVSPSGGVGVGIARHMSCEPGERSIVLVLRLGVTSINSEPLELSDLEKRLEEIFAARPGRVLLFYVEDDVPFAVAGKIIARASKIVPVAIVTKMVVAEEPSCAPRRTIVDHRWIARNKVWDEVAPPSVNTTGAALLSANGGTIRLN